MASREKKPLAPSKSKQKANNDSGLQSGEGKSKKGKSLGNLEHQQFARDVLEAVSTGSQLSAKLETSLPRKKVLRNLKRKQKLRVAKANLIKSKVTRKVANRGLCRLTSNIKKDARAKRLKLSEEHSIKQSDANSKGVGNNISNTECDGVVTEEGNRSAKGNLRTKKAKFVLKNWDEIEEELEDKEKDKERNPVAGSSVKTSLKLSRKGRNSENSDSIGKGVKAAKFTGLKKNNIKEKEICIKTESDIKYTKGRKVGRDLEHSNARSSTDIKFSKQLLDAKNSIDLTIDEVIASMLSDSEIDNQQGITDRIEGKVTRSKKMLVEESIASDIDIKKEPGTEDTKIIPDCESPEAESIQSAIQLRKRSNTLISQRSLRNGKLRQSDLGISMDAELKKHKRLNSDDPTNLELSTENAMDGNLYTESCFLESSGNYSQAMTGSIKEELCLKEESLKNFEDGNQTGLEIENNNNSDRAERTVDVGPILRSKTKAKPTEIDTKNDNIKIEYSRIISKNSELQEESKKAGNIDHVRKDSVLAKLSDKSKGRRSSLNIDMKKTVNSFYGMEKSDSNSKSQIDQMIENIKLTIAKSIESKIFGPEKGLCLNKNFEVPKIEEIIAPLSAESQKLGLEENTDEEKSGISKNEIKSESSDNSVPKVADTAKEIEKLVMGDIEPAETNSQNIQKTESQDTEACNSAHSVSDVLKIKEECNGSCKLADQQVETNKISCIVEESGKSLDEHANCATKSIDDDKKSECTEQPSKVADKSDAEAVESCKKTIETTSKMSKKCETSHASLEDTDKSEETGTGKEFSESKSVNRTATSDSCTVHTASKDAKKKLLAEETKENETRIADDSAVDTEDAETLESISKEVERLVAQDQANSQLQISTKDTERKDEPCSESVIECFPQSVDQVNSLVDIKKAEVCASETSEPEKKNIRDRVEVAENAKDWKEVEERNNLLDMTKGIAVDSECDLETSVTSVSNVNFQLDLNPLAVNPCDTVDETEKDSNENVEDDKCIRDNIVDNNNTANANSNEMKVLLNNNIEVSETPMLIQENEKFDESTEIQKSNDNDNNKRILRARDKTKRLEKGQVSCNSGEKVVSEEETTSQKVHPSLNDDIVQEMDDKSQESSTGDIEEIRNSTELDTNDLERQARTRRSKEVKKRKEDQVTTLKSKRAKREIRKSDQQNKEETLLDNEVAKINENNRSFLGKYGNGTECTTNFRGFSEGGRGSLGKRQDSKDNVRSKSENDLMISKEQTKADCDSRLSCNLSENHMTKQTENIDILDGDCKTVKTPETSQKDSDETSTSSESSSSVNVTPKILETPEDKAKKESILRLLGLESLEKAAERLSHQKAKKEQYTGTLKTVIRVQKEKEKDKRRSRSPLKMVLKQGRGDGDGDSPENFYTIQKEFGTSGWGDSSSGANRKFSTNHRHSCDEDNEDTAPKDRQSLVIPEKSSSFSIHPGRLCADVCCYCFGKFGSLDTPMHLAQMKSDERRKKILNIERHLTKDSCLCDACYRHVDRKANTSPTNMQTKPQKQHRHLMVSKCSARDCRDTSRHLVKRRWLLKIKAGLQKQVDIDWESSQHTSMSFCVSHYSKIERFLTCALCKRRLVRNHTHQLASSEREELNQLMGQQGIPVIVAAGTFVCKLCRYFTQLQLKYKDVENMNANHRSFFKSYRKRILHYHDIEVLENEDEDTSQNQSKEKDKERDKRKKAKCVNPGKPGPSKSPDRSTNSTSEKSTPEPNKIEGGNFETDNENRRTTMTKVVNPEETVTGDVQFLGIESTVEKLKKRKLLDVNPYTNTDTTITCENANEVVEILAMDKEVTLTRLPKRPRTSNDITPVVQRLGANPSISVRTLFPGEEEMNLHANIEFTNVREITPQGWEKCATMIQYDRDTKLLWQELQRPYGNQSSFLRHLILLEKYYRSGDLVLAPNASRNAINYSTSVQNRLISYEGPEKMDEPIMEPITTEYNNSRRLSGGYVLERDKQVLPSTSTPKQSTSINNTQSNKGSPSRVLKLNPGVSIIKKPPPNLQRLNLPSTSATNGTVKRKDGQKLTNTSGGKVFQLSEPDFKRLQSLKRQKQQQMLTEKQQIGSNNGSGNGGSTTAMKSATQYQKAQMAAHTQFQKHLRMQQEMLSRQSRSDFEPLICDIRTSANENNPTQNLLHNLNLPKSIQVTTKSSNQIPILPKIPKSLTVIPQTVTRPTEK